MSLDPNLNSVSLRSLFWADLEMVNLRGWRLSYLKQPISGYQRPFSLVLENRENSSVLHFESGTISELAPHDYSLIKDQFAKLDDVFCCLGIYKSPNIHPSLETNPSYLVYVNECCLAGTLPSYEVFRITNVQFLCLNKQDIIDESNNEVRKLLSSGAFYFARDHFTGQPYDLTRSVQSRYQFSKKVNRISEDTYDHRFLWNRGLMTPFLQQRVSPVKWIFPIICGSFGVSTFMGTQRGQISVISRLSNLRPGTRFNVRGVDDNGYVANFVETEVLMVVEKQVLSHVQIRGTVPLFWSQPGLQVGSHKIRVERLPQTSLCAFNRHFADLVARYSGTAIVNLMGSRAREGYLTLLYEEHWKLSDYHSKVSYTHFDYHSEMGGGRGLESLGGLLKTLQPSLDAWGFFHADGDEIKRLQTGAVRTNCIDCLDRTNVLQTTISIMMLRQHFLKAMNLTSDKSHYIARYAEDHFQKLWMENGDNVSRIYTGTGALGGDRSRFKNVQRSATRTIKNNFFDGAKQEAMVALLNTSSLLDWRRLFAGQLLPMRLHFLPQEVLRRILDRNDEFTRCERLKLFIGTWNVNGGRNVRSLLNRDTDLSDWLLVGGREVDFSAGTISGFRNPKADPEAFARPTDIVAVGFEEIIDLNAGNVVAGKQSSYNQAYWRKQLQALLDSTSQTGEPFVLLCETQLVGVCIFVFIRLGLCDHVRGLDTSSVKTGLHGKAGNKGACAFRLQVGATSVCFCCSHLTAGQSAYRERNAEVKDISKRLVLQPDKRNVLCHDYVFWFGDLNYRIGGLPNEEVKALVARAAWSDLQLADQLSIQRAADEVFSGFFEGPLCFAPTYKYDLFCDDYDTSEKARCPSWTDRILWRRAKLTTSISAAAAAAEGGGGAGEDPLKNLLAYYRAEIKTSDHRPVAALFDIDIKVVEPEKRRRVVEEELLAAGPGDATVRITWTSTSGGFVRADKIYRSIVELASSTGTIVLTRFEGGDQLLLTFSSPYEAIESMRCLHGNKVTVETASQQVILSVCLNSTPELTLETLSSARDGLQSALCKYANTATGDWLAETLALVDEAEAEYRDTHGSPPGSDVFHPTVNLTHLRRKENVTADEIRRNHQLEQDEALINLWEDGDNDDDAYEPEAGGGRPPLFGGNAGKPLRVSPFEDPIGSTNRPLPPVPPRPPPPSLPLAAPEASQLPDLSTLKDLLSPASPMHPVHSCSDLLIELGDPVADETPPQLEGAAATGEGGGAGETAAGGGPASLQPPLLPTKASVGQSASAHASPHHKTPLVAAPLLPKRLAPRPPPPPPPPQRCNSTENPLQMLDDTSALQRCKTDYRAYFTRAFLVFEPTAKSNTMGASIPPAPPRESQEIFGSNRASMPPQGSPLVPERVPPPLPERPKTVFGP